MKILDTFKAGKRTISFEFFPPKTSEGVEALFRTVDRLKGYEPSYVSVTYGAGGSTRERTVELVTRMKNETGLVVMCHVTCVAQTKKEVHSVLVRLDEQGIENILALRGDPPRGQEEFVPAEGGFRHSSELIAHARENFDFGIAAAGFPEGHLDSVDFATDMDYLKQKVESGADFIVSQLFFDNADFFAFMERVEKVGIHVPVVAGILPILSTPQIRRFTALCGARIPTDLDAKLEKYADDDDTVREIGLEHATRQAEELWRNGVAGIHFYTLNRSYSVSKSLDILEPSRV